MESPISVEEVLLVINNLKRGSVPGPGGFSTPYYKMFTQLLAPHLTCFFNSKNKGDPFDRHLNSAFISVLPKLTKDQGEVANYRPISLINNDMKILTKILANRMASFIGLYVHKYQVVFIPGREGPDQISRAINILSLLQTGLDQGTRQEGLLLSIDLQKAFNSAS